MTDLTLDEFKAEATTFLDANATLKPEATEFVWGEGSDDVALFEEISRETEAVMLGEPLVLPTPAMRPVKRSRTRPAFTARPAPTCPARLRSGRPRLPRGPRRSGSG